MNFSASLIHAIAAGLLAQQDRGTFFLPPKASTHAVGVDWNYFFIFFISLFFFILICVFMALFVWRYRRRPGVNAEITATHHHGLEAVWTVIPLIIVIFIFWFGFRTFLDMSVPPKNAMEIKVLAQKWSWSFEYPNGLIHNELHVPVDRPIALIMESADVIHSFYVPAFRIKRDVVPGRYNKLWFHPTRVGRYPLLCAEYCGTEHSAMIGWVETHEPGGHEAWLENANPLNNLDDEQFQAWLADPVAFLEANPEFQDRLAAPAAMGEQLFQRHGCGTCHSVDGSGKTGPTFLNLYGHDVVLKDGSSVTVDENYIRESLLDPLAKVVAGYEPVMPTYQGRLRDREISALIHYIKSLAEAP